MTPFAPARYALLYALLVAGLAPHHAAATDTEMKVIRLDHRPADAVLPLVKPLVTESGGRVTADGYKLIVREPAGELPRLEALVRQIDTPLKQLVITVAQDIHSPRPPGPGRNGTGPDGTRVYSSDLTGRVDTGAPDRTADGGYVHGTVSLDNDHAPQSVRVLEDRWASFRTTVQVPVLGQFLGITSGGANAANILNTIRYKALTTGFAVRARVHDQSVVLDVAPRSAELDHRRGGAIKEQAIQTTVSGRLGQWIDIGGAVNTYNAPDAKWVHSTYPLSQDLEHVWVRVQEQTG